VRAVETRPPSSRRRAAALPARPPAPRRPGSRARRLRPLVPYALLAPARREGADFDPDALDALYDRLTHTRL